MARLGFVLIGVDLIGGSIELWGARSAEIPRLGRSYNSAEQQERERVLDEWIGRVDQEARAMPRSRLDAERTLQRITAAAVQLSICALDFEHSPTEKLLRESLSQVGMDLARHARELDPDVSMPDVLQACRNAWTACGLQSLFGERLRLTPAIFAYSMLYPYSDNYLDDPAISREGKVRFNARFRRRLEGEHVRAESLREAIIWQLVTLIESQYNRAQYPQVYDSLLAIQDAQQQSMRQMQKNSLEGEADILRTTVTKGGTSVLADGYLAKGRLTDEEARFAFEWGVVLQISDDLQDVEADGRRGSRTLFSWTAGREPLDRLTNKIFHFGTTVLSGIGRLGTAPDGLEALLTKSSRTLLMRSVASVPELYTERYLQELERYSPFRFSFLRERERGFARHRRLYARLFERLLDAMPMDEAAVLTAAL